VSICFADTSFWIALSSKRDQYHARALAWSLFLVRTQSMVVTTEAVLWEWMNALSDSATRHLAAEGYRKCRRDARIEVVPFRAELIDAAMGLYTARTDKTWSLTDCLSFVVMEQRQLAEALTTDHHLSRPV
jgi:predicted nucleic acid-binding protein